jgi:Protein of unknown function (DUF3551)
MMAALASRNRHQPERIIMKTCLASLFIAVAAFAAATTGTTAPARAASEFAWCAFESNGGSQSCTYNTIDQCRAYLAGRGFCQPNPRASAMAEMSKYGKGL